MTLALELLEWIKHKTCVGTVNVKKNYNPAKHKNSFTYIVKYDESIESLKEILVIMSKTIWDMIDLTKAHYITMPTGVSMLGRGIAAMEGLLAQISPNINIFKIATNRWSSIIGGINWKKELTFHRFHPFSC